MINATHLRHELRTPLNAIIGYSEMLLEDVEESGEEAFVSDLRKIHSAGKHLLEIVNTALDAKKFEADQSECDLKVLGTLLHYKLSTPLNTVIACSVILQESAKNCGQAEHIPDLQKIHAAAEGFLALVKNIGNLSPIEPGKGEMRSKTVVESIRPAEPESDVIAENQGTLLVVDDNAMNRDLLSRHLKRQGYVVMEAANGRKALEMITTQAFDLILLDLMMPEMNGYQVLEILKNDETLRNIPVIMISASDEIQSVVQCIEMGAEDYLPKPFDPILLRARIGASLEKKRFHDKERAYLKQLQIEQEKSERLLLNVLPTPIAERLKQGESTIANNYAEVTVMFADIVGFTELSAQSSPTKLVVLLNVVFSIFDSLADEHGLEKIKTIGDAYMVVGGLPTPRPDHAEAIAEMALGMQQEIAQLNEGTGQAFSIRIGIDTGPVIAGVIGTKKFSYDLWGDTVNTASRMESHGIAGRIQVTEATYALLKDKYRFEERGILDIKGKGKMKAYLLTGRNS